MKTSFVRAADADRHYVEALLRDPRFKSAYSSPPTVAAMREATALFAATPAGKRIAPGVSVEPTVLAGLSCETYTPAAAAPGQLIVYLFGGGFVRGSLDLARANATSLAAATGRVVISVGYSQAPERPFPAASQDVLQVWRALLDQGFAPKDVVIVGESAGGCLALTLPAWAMRERLPLPAGVAGLSPMTDMRMQTPSWHYNVDHDIATAEMGHRMVELYIPDDKRDDDLVAPINSAVAQGLPVFLCVGSHESMLSDVERYGLYADAAGADVTLAVYEAMPHGFTKFDIPLASRAIEDAAAWSSALLTPSR